MVEALVNPMEQYREFLKQLHDRREVLKGEINERTAELQGINEQLDGEKERAKELFHMTVRTRKPRKEKVAADGTEVVTEKKQRKGRKGNKEVETATA